MQITSRLLAGLVAGSLIFSFAGSLVFCAGCGSQVMECCKGMPAASESIGTNPCCQFKVSSTTEQHPGRVISSVHSTQREEAGVTDADDVSFQRTLSAVVPRLSPSPSPPHDSNPPLFILNASLLC
jgi:hypothetical protein